MPRRKPRYTPDAPPVNASPDQVLAWVNAQFQRIEDYWPRDDGERIDALEEAIGPIQKGTWDIVGLSDIRFEGFLEETGYPWVCEIFTEDSLALEQTQESTAEAPYFSVDGDYIIVSSVLTGLNKINKNTLGLTQIVASNVPATSSVWNFHSSCVIDFSGTKAIALGRRSGDSSIVTIFNFDTGTQLANTSLGGFGRSAQPVFDTTDYIIALSYDTSRVFALPKADLNSEIIGFSLSEYHAAPGVSDYDDNKFYEASISSGASQTLRLTERRVYGGEILSTTLADIDLSTYDANGDWPMRRSTIPRRGDEFWFTVNGTDRAGFARVQTDGSMVGVVWIVDGQTWDTLTVASGGTMGSQWPYYDETTDKFYWADNDLLCRYDPVENMMECCSIDDPDELLSGESLVYQRNCILDGDYLWVFGAGKATPVTGSYASLVSRIKVYE